MCLDKEYDSIIGNGDDTVNNSNTGDLSNDSSSSYDDEDDSNGEGNSTEAQIALLTSSGKKLQDYHFVLVTLLLAWLRSKKVVDLTGHIFFTKV